jgi:1-acyl-sn-glycerol-3-phosphate acyltransferase
VKARAGLADFCAALARKALWRLVLTATGGLRARGLTRLPDGPCVIVANHNSHADTAALIAALPARRGAAPTSVPRAVLASTGLRPWACQALCGAFPVRRGGGGMADLAEAARLLAAGRDVVIYPEGSRSRDGSIGEFRHGAARLAVLSGTPLVPIAITGTRELLPASGTGARGRRTAVTVCIGVPVHAGIPAATAVVTSPAAEASGAQAQVTSRPGAPDAVSSMTAQARARVAALAAGQPSPALPDSELRVRGIPVPEERGYGRLPESLSQEQGEGPRLAGAPSRSRLLTARSPWVG